MIFSSFWYHSGILGFLHVKFIADFRMMVMACSGCQFGLCRWFTYRTIIPPTTSRSGIALLRCRGWHKVVGVEGEEERGESGCWRWNSSTTAGAWTPKLGSHMLSECDQPMNLTRYHNLPHLNLESRTSSTSYSSWSLMMMGPGCGGCRHLAMSSGMYGWMLQMDT